MAEEVKHTGGCHCGAVRFQVFSPRDVTVYNCNCTICTKKGILTFLVPDEKFTITKGEDNITTYSYNTHKAKHYFCKTCGIHSFYKPRPAPKGMGIDIKCVDEETIGNVTTKCFDGVNYEESLAAFDKSLLYGTQ